MKEGILLLACSITILVIYDRWRRFGWDFAWQGPLICIVLSVPMALNLPVRAFYLDCRVLISAVILGFFLFVPTDWIRQLRPLPSDFLLFMLMASFLATDIATRTAMPFGVLNTWGQWVLPYVLGRLLIRQASDIKHFMTPVNLALIAWSFLSFIEGMTHVNLWQKIAGIEMDYDITEVRFGMKRAHGSQAHPISWGLTFAMMFCLMLEASRLAGRGEGPSWWRWVPWLMIPGLISTGSRGVQMSALIIVLVNVYYLYPQLRALMIVGSISACLGFFVFRDEVVHLLTSSVEDVNNTEYLIIRGERHVYTGTKHRDLLNLVYYDAINDAGLFGFGNPLQDLPQEEIPDARFKSIDNHYLHIYLHNGWLGLSVFAVFIVFVVGNVLYVILHSESEASLAYLLLGMLIAMLIIFRTVWMDMNYGWFFMLFCGLTATLVNSTVTMERQKLYQQYYV